MGEELMRILAPVATIRPGEPLTPDGGPLRLETTPRQLIELVDLLSPAAIRGLMLVLEEARVSEGPAGRWIGVHRWGRRWLIERGMTERNARRAVAELEDQKLIVPARMFDPDTGKELYGPKMGVIGAKLVAAGEQVSSEFMWRGRGPVHQQGDELDRNATPWTETSKVSTAVEPAPGTELSKVPNVSLRTPWTEMSKGGGGADDPLDGLVGTRWTEQSKRSLKVDVEERNSLLVAGEVDVARLGAVFGSPVAVAALGDPERREAAWRRLSGLDENRVHAVLGGGSGPPARRWLAEMLLSLAGAPAADHADQVLRVLAGADVVLRPLPADRLVGGFWVVCTAIAVRPQAVSSPNRWVASLMLKDMLKRNAGVDAIVEMLYPRRESAAQLGVGLDALLGGGAPVEAPDVFSEELEAAVVDSEHDNPFDRANIARNPGWQKRLIQAHRNKQTG